MQSKYWPRHRESEREISKVNREIYEAYWRMYIAAVFMFSCRYISCVLIFSFSQSPFVHYSPLFFSIMIFFLFIQFREPVLLLQLLTICNNSSLSLFLSFFFAINKSNLIQSHRNMVSDQTHRYMVHNTHSHARSFSDSFKNVYS